MLRQIELAYAVEVADGVDAKDTDWIRRVWDSARTAMLFRKEKEYLLVIDEIQKIANWSEAVKKEWDEDTRKGVNLKVVLLGSSRLLLKKGLTESLAGRYELIRLGHWRYQEMRDAFGFTVGRVCIFRGLSRPGTFDKKRRRWKKYVKDSLVAPAIDKDVIMTSNIYKPALMKRLLSWDADILAEILSLTKLIGQLQDAGNVTTLAGYLEILINVLCWPPCRSMPGMTHANTTRYPKYQVYNNALMTVYRGQTFEKDRTDPKGLGVGGVESAVGAYLLSMAENGLSIVLLA